VEGFFWILSSCKWNKASLGTLFFTSIRHLLVTYGTKFMTSLLKNDYRQSTSIVGQVNTNRTINDTRFSSLPILIHASSTTPVSYCQIIATCNMSTFTPFQFLEVIILSLLSEQSFFQWLHLTVFFTKWWQFQIPYCCFNLTART